MNKSFISMLLVMTMIGGLVLGAFEFDSNNVVMALQYNQGYSLEAEDMDSTGVNINSGFILKTEEAKDIEFIKQNLSINGDIKLQIEQKDSKTYFIKPEKSLLKNKIYQFNLKLENTEENWNFQTMSDFGVLGSLPRNQSTKVPINTGIEINFTHEGTDQIAKYFEIEPSVEGEFEIHDRVAVFVPKELKPGTIYKVTLKKGLKVKDSAQQLSEDYSFSFETQKKEDVNEEQEKGSFYFKTNMNEFSTEGKQLIPFSYYINNRKDNTLDDHINVNVYAYKSIDEFIEGMQKTNSVPQWARYNFEGRLVNTKKLEKAVSFKQTLPDRNQREKFIEIPQNLKSGYYVVEGVWEDVKFQTFVQVTDIGVYQTKDKDKTYIWLNDIKTEKPINKASVKLSGTNLKWESNDNGIVKFETPNSDEPISYYIIEANDGKSIVVTSGYNNELYGHENQNYNYWKYIKTDRNMYKPTDTVQFYGYIQNRYKEENIDRVKVEIKENSYIWGYKNFPGNEENSLDHVELNVENGFFEGELKLPYLDNGHYNLTVKLKDEVILSTYITVEDYIKPAYKIEISKDKKAIFVDEKVNFNIKSSFFEGTPVSNLDIDYNTYGITNESGKVKTDIKGNAVVDINPKYKEGLQDRRTVGLWSNASLPESGRITGDESVDVYINDINVGATGEIKDNKITLEAQVNYIDLKPLNDEDTENDKEYIGGGVDSKKITGEIFKNEWKKKEVGQYYDFINKVVRKKYEYYTEKTKVKSFEIVTDNKGYGKFELNVSDIDECYYTAEIKTEDSKGRVMKYSPYISRSTSSNEKINRGEIRRPEYDDYKLDGGKENYKLNEDVKLTFKNNEEVMPEGRYLFIQAQNGIKNINVQNSPIYNGEFEERDIPNIIIKGVYFNGKTYIESTPFNAIYDFKQKEILLSAKTDKESYKPGEECTVTIKAQALDSETNEFNEGKKAIVNLSIVDEAIFSMQEEYIDTLEQLYQRLPSGINYSYISHGGNSDIVRYNGGIESEKSMADGASNEMLKSAFNNSARGESKVKIRSDFKDTALFKTVRLDEKGEGKLIFKLPDNVTSWRISMSAISNDIDAGSNKVNLNVSLPYFINQSINTTYLVGDKPYIGLTSYGEDLKEGEKITYEVTCAQKSDFISTVTAKAFERVSVPLWELEEGNYDLVVKSTSESGLTDGMTSTIKVVNTYHQIQKAKHEKLLPNMNIVGGNKGITKLVFANDSISKYIYELYNLAYTSGNRIDQKVIAYSAKKLLKDKFEQDDVKVEDIKLSDYQTNDGAISLLPYSDNDLELSAKLISIVKNDMDISKVKAYLYDVLYDKGSQGEDKVIALYGLAQLQEPVLLELDKKESIQNLSLKEYIYMALAYAELNEYNKANLIYEEKITPYIEDYEVDSRVKSGSEDDNLYYTALTSVLASKLNKENKEKLHNFARNNYSKEVLVKVENYLYILNEINDKESQTAEFSYTYRGEKFDKEIKDSRIVTLKIPSVNLKDFNVTSVEGNISVVTVFEEELKDKIKEDKSLKVSKVYTKYEGEETKEFSQGDIVKVIINYDIKEDAIDDFYEIIDYAPSGLKPIESSYNRGEKLYIPGYYRNIESGKVTFYVNKNNEEKKPLYYYARVVTTGTYKAEGVIIQGTRNRDSLYISDQDTITIK